MYLNRLLKVEKMAKIEQKVKVKPLPFWSVLAFFSNFLKWFKKALKNIQKCLKTISKEIAFVFEPSFKS